MSRHLFSALVLALSLLSGVAVAQTGTGQLGKSFGGEACHAASDPVQGRPTEILCGETAQIAGRLETSLLNTPLPGTAAARRDVISASARTAADALSISEQLACDSGQFLGDGDILIYLCAMQSTSWPRILLVSGSGRTLVQAEGMPSLLPVLVSAMAAVTGHEGTQADIAAGRALLATRVAPQVLTAQTADFVRYSRSIESARVYSSRDDYAAAETALRGALEINTRLFGEDSMPAGLTLIELGLQVSNQGRFDEAAGFFRRATPIIEASVNADARAQLNSYLALDAANQRNYPRALAYARQATAERRAQLKSANSLTGAGFSGMPSVSSGELAHSLRIEGEMALRLDDLPSAQAAAEEALWIISLEPGLALWWRADVLSLMAEVYERRGRVSAAERSYLDAIELRRKLFGESAPLVMAHLTAGRFYAGQQLYPKALEQFRAAMAMLGRNPVARSRMVPDQVIPFLETVQATDAGPQQRAMLDTEVFRAVQYVNSDVADQAIARASVRLAAATPALASLVRDAQEAQRQSDRIRIEIAAELAKSKEERNAEREKQMAQDLVLATARTTDLFGRIQKDFPGYARLTSPQPAELSDVRAQLAPRQALLVFLVGVQGGYGLLVTRDGLTVKQLDVTSSSLTQDIALLRQAFRPQLGALPEFSLHNAYGLYTRLLGPFAEGLAQVDHLVVAPGPVLTNLPFSLLVRREPTDNAGYGSAAWLVRDMAVSQVPSTRAFLSLRQAERSRVAAQRPFLGVGDPSLTGDTGGAAALESLASSCRDASPVQPALLRALDPLHDTAGEIHSVAQALGASGDAVLLGAAASEAGLRKQPLDQYRVLYFATHGLLPGELHCQAEPGLVLSPPSVPATSTDTDGLLEAGEIALLRLNADLVALSACNTAAAGQGRFGGDALEGLADAFFNAGARAVLASHWEVSSAATARLMTGLFQRYGRDRAHGLAQALRQSQLDMIATPDTAHPFYWAAFTLIGVGESQGSNDTANFTPPAKGGTL